MSGKWTATAVLTLVVAAGSVCLLRDGDRPPSAASPVQEAVARHACVREVSLPRGTAMSFDKEVFRRYAKADVSSFDLDDELRLGDEIRMTLFETLRLSLVIERQMKSTGRHRVFLASSGGREGPRAVILQKEDGVIVHVTDDVRASNFIVGLHRHLTWVGEYGSRLVPIRCGNGVDAPLRPDQALRNEPPAEKLADGSVVVDVLVASDARAVKFASRQGLSHEEFAELTLQQANIVLEQSGLLDEFSFRLVHSVDLGGSLGDDLSRALQHVSKGFPLNGVELHEPVRLGRERHGADIAVVLMDRATNSLAGISQGLGGDAYLKKVECAYCVCDMQAAMGYTMAHEIGHLLGAGHSDQQETYQGPQLFEFSAGCYGDDWHSVMAYSKEGHARSIGRFSSPELSEDDAHDNVQTLRLTYARVSNYRPARDRNPVASTPAKKAGAREADAGAAEPAATNKASAASGARTGRQDGGDVLPEDAEADNGTPNAARRRKGRATVSLEQFRRFVQAASTKQVAVPIVAEVPAGSILNIDTEQIAREFKENHPEVVEVMTDFLPDGVSLEQLASGRIVPQDGDDVAARKSGLRLKVDSDGILSGKFKLIFRDAEGKSSVEVNVIGRLMDGESAGVASIAGDDSGPWYVTIAPDETSGEAGQEKDPGSGADAAAQGK